MKFCCRIDFSLPKHPKNLEPSCKVDLDFWECIDGFRCLGLFWKGKHPHLITKQSVPAKICVINNINVNGYTFS